MTDDAKQLEWDDAYRRGDNFLFYPNEEVVRFFARHIAKRTGVSEVSFRQGFNSSSRVLDFGCGIGRHVRFLLDLTLDGVGIDLSAEAVAVGRRWLVEAGYRDAAGRLTAGDGRELPYPAASFDVALAHGVLDSMPFDIALACISDLARVIRPGGLFYLDLISGDDSDCEPGFAGELVVDKAHERGTVQSYFDEAKINRLLDGNFTVRELVFVHRSVLTSSSHGSRYHVIAERLAS
ncbi:class I SAM-dependent methyltransferase [Pannonibacter sp.]|uniref:class I SAM-dependent methyltransferase n=1 Tax=Pannonibacter sp. TaxID=1906786 RepID=UPI003F71AC6A